MKLKTLLCLCALTACMQTLQAADTAGKTYFKLDGGVALMDDIEVKNIEGFGDIFGLVDDVKLKTDMGVRVDLAGGYNFTRSWAIELEAGFTWNTVSDIEAEALGQTVSEEFDMDIFQIPMLANIIYRLPLDSKFKPYVGAGAGAVVSLVSGDDFESETDIAFAFQGMAGVDYEIGANTDIGIGYKFLGALEQNFAGVETDNIYTHSILAVFNFRF